MVFSRNGKGEPEKEGGIVLSFYAMPAGDTSCYTFSCALS